MAFFYLERGDLTLPPGKSGRHDALVGPLETKDAVRLKEMGKLIFEADKNALPVRVCPACKEVGVTKHG